MWREFLTLSRREQIGLIFLFTVLMVLIIFLFVKPKFEEPVIDKDLLSWIADVQELNDSLFHTQMDQNQELFSFDPNEVNKDELFRLGFSERATNNLLKYREAGGIIKDFQKLSQIYGMDSLHLERIKPFVVFENHQVDKFTPKAIKKFRYKIDLNSIDSTALAELNLDKQVLENIRFVKKDYYFNKRLDRDSLQEYNFEAWCLKRDSLLLPKKNHSLLSDKFVIELNTADTAELVLLKGIGRVYAQRIIYHRNKLGGFYSIKQLLEIDGISPIVLSDNKEYINIDTSIIKKVNINTSSLKRMKDHPYMDFYMAKDIYEARKVNWPVKLEAVMASTSFDKADKELIRKYFCDSE